MQLGEHLLHGRDIARAVGRPWPLDPRDARLVLDGAFAWAPLFVDAERARGLTAAFELRVRGGPRGVFRFGDGRLRVEPSPAGPVDCRVAADPVALLLVVYGRTGPWGPIARGRLLAWGRRPWLGLRFARAFWA